MTFSCRHKRLSNGLALLALGLFSINSWAGGGGSDFRLAQESAQRGEFSAAIILYQGLIAQHPNEPSLYNNLAALLAQQGDLDGARTALEQGILVHQTMRVLYENLTQVVASQARDNYAKALRIKERPPATELVVLNGWSQPAAPKSDVTVAVVEPVIEAVGEPVAQPESAPEVVAVAVIDPAPTQPPPPLDSSPTQLSETVDLVKPQKGDNDSPGSGVVGWVKSWSQAWQEQRLDDYLASYRVGYTPNRRTSHRQWVTERQQRIVGKREIEIELEQLEVTELDGERYQVDFIMRYRSDSYRDRSKKRLKLATYDGELKITSERTLRVLP